MGPSTVRLVGFGEVAICFVGSIVNPVLAQKHTTAPRCGRGRPPLRPSGPRIATVSRS